MCIVINEGLAMSSNFGMEFLSFADKVMTSLWIFESRVQESQVATL